MRGGQAVDEKSLLATKQVETSKQFWDEALAKQKELDLTELEMKMAVLHVCGMPSWKTLESSTPSASPPRMENAAQSSVSQSTTRARCRLLMPSMA